MSTKTQLDTACEMVEKIRLACANVLSFETHQMEILLNMTQNPGEMNDGTLGEAEWTALRDISKSLKDLRSNLRAFAAVVGERDGNIALIEKVRSRNLIDAKVTTKANDEAPTEAKALAKELAQVECDHGLIFDSTMAKGLSPNEVRKRWPRLMGTCPKGCGFEGIGYASTEHFVMGDW
jgi:hypothetical protein